VTAVQAAINLLFADPNLSVAATYRPRAGAEVSVRLLRQRRGHSDFDAGFQVGATAPADHAELRVAEMAAPQEGDVLDLGGGERYRVRKAELDGERLVWLLDLDRVF
jgi:hypothetical protein